MILVFVLYPFETNHSDQSRLATPHGGDCKKISQNSLNCGLGLIEIYPDPCWCCESRGGCSWEESLQLRKPLAFGKSIHVFDLFIVIFHDFSLYIMVNHHDITMKSPIMCKTLLAKMFSKSMELKMMVFNRDPFFQGAAIFTWAMLTFRCANRIPGIQIFLMGGLHFQVTALRLPTTSNVIYDLICSWLWAETN